MDHQENATTQDEKPKQTQEPTNSPAPAAPAAENAVENDKEGDTGLDVSVVPASPVRTADVLIEEPSTIPNLGVEAQAQPDAAANTTPAASPPRLSAAPQHPPHAPHAGPSLQSHAHPFRPSLDIGQHFRMSRVSSMPRFSIPDVQMARRLSFDAAHQPVHLQRGQSTTNLAHMWHEAEHHAPRPSYELPRMSSSISLDMPPDWRQPLATFHTMSEASLVKLLQTNMTTGLTDSEVEVRLNENGPNKLTVGEGLNPCILLLKHFFSFLVILLLVCAALYNNIPHTLQIAMIFAFATFQWIEAGVLAFIVCFNTFLGFSQEYKSEKTLAALQKLSTSSAVVIRNGKKIPIPAEQVVNGDVVDLTVGEAVPADVRLIGVKGLEIDEAMLTGEPVPVKKTTKKLNDSGIPLGDRINMAYSGCIVTQGKGRGIVVATGSRTELGRIAKSISDVKAKPTALQVEIRTLSILLFAIGVGLGVVVFASNKFAWSIDTMLYAVSIVVAIIPEALPVVMTMSMANGVKQMAKRNVIVRKLAALEQIGRITNICSDKTGTLTQAKMVAEHLLLAHRIYRVTGQGLEPKGDFMMGDTKAELDDATLTALKVCSLCNASSISQDKDGKWVGIGSPTEVLATKGGVGKPTLMSSGEWSLLAEHPFDSSTKTMINVYNNNKDGFVWAFMKGAPERVAAACVGLQIGEDFSPFPANFLEVLSDQMNGLTAQGMRVLGLAYRNGFQFSEELSRNELQQDMIFLGLVGIYDPPRPESRPAVEECAGAGITVHMLTGDHITTAVAIGRQLNLVDETNADVLSMSAPDFESLDTAAVDSMIELPRVIGRCSPDTKVKVVKALHRRDRVVAMTGDGVNDAPALKTADIGVAMGISGSEVAKQAADIVLTDDNFSSIVNAIAEGRRIFANVRNIIVHLLTSNLACVLILMIGLAFRDSAGEAIFPMSPIEILWANTVLNDIVGAGLAYAPPTDNLMKYGPPKSAGVFTRETIADILFYGITAGGLGLGTFSAVFYGIHGGQVAGTNCNREYIGCDTIYRARASVYVMLGVILIVNAFNCRSPRGFIWQYKEVKEIKLLGICALCALATIIASVYIPVINYYVFHHYAIDVEWAIVAGCLVIFVVLTQLYKLWKRKNWPMESPVRHVARIDEKTDTAPSAF